MLIASGALHLSLTAGLVFDYFHESVTPTASLESPPVMLLTTEKSPAPLRPTLVTRSAPEPMAASVPATHPTSTFVSSEKAVPVLPPAHSLFTEKNPNAHAPAAVPDAVLSPNPAPQLDGADGIVFILDISGSMYEPYDGTTRLALARQALSRQIRALKDGTPFAITLYAQRAVTSGPLVAASPVTREAAVRFILRDVDCGGGTDLPVGLAAAQQLHSGYLVLASDGDLNSSASNLTTRAASILGTKGHCPSLTVLGISPRMNVGDEQLLQALADQQGGTYHWIQPGDDRELITAAARSTKPASATP